MRKIFRNMWTPRVRNDMLGLWELERALGRQRESGEEFREQRRVLEMRR